MNAPSLTLLQRVRFCSIEPGPADSYGPGFDPNLWRQRAWTTYWRVENRGTNAFFSPDGIQADKGVALFGDTFFNAFYAAYWRKLTRVGSLFLRLRFAGRFALRIHRHTEWDEAEVVDSAELGRDGETEFEYAFDAAGGLPAGLRFSFALASLSAGSRFLGGGWYTAEPLREPVRLGIVLATYNRHRFVEPLIQRILDDPHLRDEPIVFRVVDQSEEARLGHFDGERCRIIRQRNLGTAGFTRGICEALDEKGAPFTHVLLMDDDITFDTDSILRALRMAQFARRPVLIGAVMLDLHVPDTATCVGDFFRPNDLGFHAIRQNLPGTRLDGPNVQNLLSVPAVYDYCAWWFCLIPVEAIRKTGLPIPFFLRMDDIQHGVRLKEAGYEPHTVPGLGVWHVPFYAKNMGWLLSLERYNHLIVNSLYGLAPCIQAFRRYLEETPHFLAQRNYPVAEATVRAMEDFLAGWGAFCARVFPDVLPRLKAGYDAFPPEPEATRSIQARLKEVARRFPTEGPKAQAEFAAEIPRTYARESWDRFLATGTLAPPAA